MRDTLARARSRRRDARVDVRQRLRRRALDPLCRRGNVETVRGTCRCGCEFVPLSGRGGCRVGGVVALQRDQRVDMPVGDCALETQGFGY